MIIALFALAAGLHEVVKASVAGSLLGNILLVMGVSMLAGGLKRDRQHFEPRAASAQLLMLLLATVALIMPAIFQLVHGGGLPDPTARAVEFDNDLKTLSVGVAVILLVSYAAGLLFSLKTHKDLFNPSHEEDDHGGEPWTVRRSVLMLAGAGVAVGVMSEILVSSITEASETLGLSPFFVGVIVVAVVGNAAEHWVSVYFAVKNKIGLSVNIAVGSAAQIALFVAPVLVLASFFIGPFPMALVFNGVRDRGDLPRSPHRGRDHPTRGVHVVRGSATAGHLCRTGTHVLLRLVGAASLDRSLSARTCRGTLRLDCSYR